MNQEILPQAEQERDEQMVRALVDGLVHALPSIANVTARLPDARSRAAEFAAALAHRRAA